MKPLKENLLRKDATITKIQFDKEWFYKLKDIVWYLNEDLSAIESIYLPITIDGKSELTQCVTFEDILRARKEK
ncbi:hypothetical protein [Flavobacterium crassostreae]|uniref:Uncharacterized protein n=1 Tax=Flavobacterium crassostreae TaxID=1763534 RepID=A0A1B9EA40_9FLAO|nr:hypothetical protein [Flavobacterium crassostreae]OCB78814.1 hypothetical protein LPBF_00045 [Flavobacterium crassostreae]